MSSARYLTPAEAGKLRKVSAQTVRTYMRGSGPLVAAVSDITGKRGAKLLDSEHPAFVLWLESDGAGRKKKTARKTNSNRLQLAELETDEIDRLESLITELTNTYGQYDQVYQWAKVRKEIAAANTAELKRDEYKGQLIRREFVSKHVIGLIDGLLRRLLTETAHTIAKRVGEQALAGAKLPARKAIAADLITATIVQVKHEVIDSLKGRDEQSESAQ